jgi:acyl-CoA synthetase (AMP-forming)/AMP-acid ligase II/1-acyl-sn-glycerol-3-phosphate acyltransferase/acyl carrier protein
MIDLVLRSIARGVLRLRYRVRVRGLEEVRARGTRGILFLPNHPALIDPVLVVTFLWKPFRPRPLADEDQIRRWPLSWVARYVGMRPIPDIRTRGLDAAEQIRRVIADCRAGLAAGENIVLYPSGHLYRSRHENLRGNSAAEQLVKSTPAARVVLVRTRGLWGSVFSLAGGRFPSLGAGLKKGLWALLKSLVFFTPRREVTIELFEPDDLPRDAGRAEFNAYLERFYNEDAPPSTYVPYSPWEGGGRVELPDPPTRGPLAESGDVPEATRQIVLEHLRQRLEVKEPRDTDRLSQDLGMDSLAKAELIVWLGAEFGQQVADVSALETVGDVLLAARGEAMARRQVDLRPVPPAWFRSAGEGRLSPPAADSLTQAMLEQARLSPGQVIVADQVSGALSYRGLLIAIFALKPLIARLSGERVGIMLPASVGATIAYFAALFAGKTPVMVNWTTGTRNIAHALELLGVRCVLTARPLVARIEGQGADLGSVKDRFVYLEDLRRRIGVTARLWAVYQGCCDWADLERARPTEVAAILLTSGSEALPKAVPLTHANILANLRDVLGCYALYPHDRLVGFLPPFHSFGLSVTMILPLLGGMPVVYHANPTDAWVLARLIQAYRATIVVGTPTFLYGIVRTAEPEQLASLRIAVTGAEKCPERTYAALAAACPQLKVLEGYGASECSPIIAANPEHAPRPGTIGTILPSYESAIVDPDTLAPVPQGRTGMLLVRGPSVFGGYMGEAASPFVEHAGSAWYRTGDLVTQDPDGYLTFRGRLKRFVKLGGEMISLPAIEAVLEAHYGGEPDEGPTLAVEATASEEHPEIVLFTTRELDRREVNERIRAAHLSPLHNVARVVRVDEIPLLGTGKTDYRALRQWIESAQPARVV